MTLLSDLKQIQLDLGIDKSIEPQKNYIRAKFIEDRIDALLPISNFFFHKIFKGDSEDIDIRTKNKIERRELNRLIKAHEKYERYYIKKGQIMPQFLTEDERKLLTEGMEISIDKIGYEVLKSSKLTEKITGRPSEEVVKRHQ